MIAGRARGLFVLVCLSALSGANVQAQGSGPAVGSLSAKLDLCYVSRYVWRGLVLNPDPAFQPSVTLSHASGLSLNIWGSIDTTGIGEQLGYGHESGHPTEIDYALDYAWARDVFSFSVGLIGYTFPNTRFDSTGEVYGSVCFGGRLSPIVSVNYDFDEAGGLYASLSISHACRLAVGKTAQPILNLGARVSFASADYNRFYFGQGKSAFTDLLLSVSVPFPISDKLRVAPTISYSMILDGDLRGAVSKPDNLIVGLALACAFQRRWGQ